jgi:DNA-directed RNA polymerase subunit RPC12/RpoP
MAIVHPAFCGMSADPVEPIPKRMIALCRIPPCGYKTLQKPRVQRQKR